MTSPQGSPAADRSGRDPATGRCPGLDRRSRASLLHAGRRGPPTHQAGRRCLARPTAQARRCSALTRTCPRVLANKAATCERLWPLSAPHAARAHAFPLRHQSGSSAQVRAKVLVRSRGRPPEPCARATYGPQTRDTRRQPPSLTSTPNSGGQYDTSLLVGRFPAPPTFQAGDQASRTPRAPTNSE